MPSAPEVPVLVAGAGPAGLVASIALARLGVPVLLAERRTELSSLPRATMLSTRSMELLRLWGLEAEARALAVEVEHLGMQARSLADAERGTTFTLGLPTRAQAAMLSPTGPAWVPQDRLEPLLLRHLRGLPSADVRLGTAVDGVRVHGDEVVVTLRDTRTRIRTEVLARHLVGADGAHSAVRTQLGIAMHGPDDLAEAATALVRGPLWALAGEHRYGIYATDEGTLLPAGGDRWLFGRLREPGAGPAELLARLPAAAGDPGLRVHVERTGEFRFAARLAEAFRAGPVFLVGDAAHRVTPRGGTGMNTAIHDARDLGWRLGWVLRGWAPPSLLDGFEAERRPVAEHNAARSAREDGTTQDPVRETQADLGGRIAHVWAGEGVSTLDLLGPGITAFTAPGAREPHDTAGPPLTVRPLPALAARALGLTPGGTLLVRPDGVPAAPTQARPRLAAAAAA
jgi:putative polyketide hydroxylase